MSLPCHSPPHTLSLLFSPLPPHPQSDYLHMVKACAERDRQQVVQRSTSLGFLTGACTWVLSAASWGLQVQHAWQPGASRRWVGCEPTAATQRHSCVPLASSHPPPPSLYLQATKAR